MRVGWGQGLLGSAELRCGGEGGGDRASRRPADVAQPKGAGQLAQGEGVDDAAGDAAFHSDIETRPEVGLLRGAVPHLALGVVEVLRAEHDRGAEMDPLAEVRVVSAELVGVWAA